MSAPDFWNDQGAAQKVIDEMNRLKEYVETMTKLDNKQDDLQVMLELIAEEGDEGLLEEAARRLGRTKKRVKCF